MKKTVERKINRYDTIESPSATYLTPENLPKETSERQPEQGSVELVGMSGGGLRVKWNYTKEVEGTIDVGTTVEELNKDGEWVTVGGIQKLTIEFDTKSYLPVVNMERIIF